MDGTIKWFDVEKGYGFISSSAGDIFLHASAIIGLQPGASVRFDVVPGPHGPMASDVRLAAAVHDVRPTGVVAPDHGATVPSRGVDESAFRGVPWRSSPADARAREADEPIHSTPEMLVFDGTVADIPCHVVYLFAAGELSRGKYILQRHSDEQLISDFLRLEGLLKEKYGAPDEINDFWKDPDYARFGITSAISQGMLSMYRVWTLASTTVAIVITAEDFDVRVAVEYQSVEMEAQDAEVQQARALRDL